MPVSIDVCEIGELGQSQLDLWRKFQDATPILGNPFLTPEFARVFANHRSDARVAVIQDAGEVAGFFPFELGRLGVARALAYGLADAQAPVMNPDAGVACLATVMAGAGLAVVEFDHLLTPEVTGTGASQCLAPSPVADVGSMSWDEWLDAKRKQGGGRRIKSALEKRRKLERQRGAVTFEFDSRNVEMLHTLMDWKSRQYRRTGRPDRFARPWFREMVEELFETREHSFSSRLSVMYVEDRPVTIDFSVASHGILSGWFPSYDPEFSHYSPGFNGIIEIIRAIGSDPEIDCLDMGKGASDYKESLKTREVMVAEGWLDNASLRAKLWRARTEPRRRALEVVLGNQRLRLAARRTLRHLGRIRGHK